MCDASSGLAKDSHPDEAVVGERSFEEKSGRHPMAVKKIPSEMSD
jgi:hypothetical protein